MLVFKIVKSLQCILKPNCANGVDKKFQLDNVEYEVVDQLSACRGAEPSSISHSRSGWKKIREFLPLLTSQIVLPMTKGKLYSACIRRYVRRMVWWMCHVSLRDRKPSEELQNRLGNANITDILVQPRLRWFGHVQKMDKENPLNNCWFIEIGGQGGKGRPCKSWTQLINDDLKVVPATFLLVCFIF